MYIWEGGLTSTSDFLYKLQNYTKDEYLVSNNKYYVYNIPAAFDIEVSSFYEGEEKRAIMYLWQFGIYNMVTTGRTWDEFKNLINLVQKILCLSNERRLYVYVHNLPYEFQFIRKMFKWDKIFLLDERKPIYALYNGIEFRCSLKLSGGKSLEKVGADLKRYKIEKKVGFLNYDKLRTPLTKLTGQELEYGEYDIRVILCYIQEKIEQDGNILKIPLTNTGYVREYCRKQCYSRWKPYRKIMESLTIEEDEYMQLKRAFQGGFVHANAHYVGEILENVSSHDIRSSYPTVMVLEKFPMTRPVSISNGISESELVEILLTHCCLFDLYLFDVTPKKFHEHPISLSKCWKINDYVVDNGRIVMAASLAITITEQDFFTYHEFYNWDRMEIKNLKVYQKNYLPKPLIKTTLKLYWDKTALKDIESQKINYMISKNMINAEYGMMVTDIVRDSLEYEEDVFIVKKGDVKELLSKYNKNIKRFLYYPWGVWVTAYARANLFSGILELGDDYIYSDTDSLKSLNPATHEKYFNNYNDTILNKIDAVSSHYNIPKEIFSPKTKSGKEKTIGFWDDEGIYSRFKTLGAKRYLTERMITRTLEDDGCTIQLTEPKYEITLAGSHKEKTMIHLRKSLNIFDSFDNHLVVPSDSSGRLTLTYIDYETEGDVEDIDGNIYHYHELSSVHMEKSEYSLSMSKEFIDYLKGVKDFGE